ncbi:MAG: polysaccharide pyruvyl transferase family protein, partial [Candidatus Peregrinibacteria bacterium]
TSHLINALPLIPHDTLTILTTPLRGKEADTVQFHTLQRTYSVERCFSASSWGLFQLLTFIIRTRPDVTHLQHETFLYGGPLSILLFPLVMRVMRRFTAPVVTLHHVVHPDSIDRAFTRMQRSLLPPLVIRIGYRVFFRLLARSGASVIVHGEVFRKTLITCYRFPPARIAVIPHGIEDPLPHAQLSVEQRRERFRIPSDAETVFGFFGSLTGYKGIEYLLDEFESHVRTHPRSVLFVAGYLHPSNPGQKNYADFAEKMKERAERALPGRIIWHGPLEDAEIGDFFHCVDCLILPYRTCFGQSGPLSYAIGSGTPFLASEALKPIVPLPAPFFPLEKGALSERMGAFRTLTPEERTRLHQEIRSFGQQRSWRIVAQSTYGLYGNLASLPHTPPILLLGAYGQCNLGDELLLAQCLRLLPQDRCIVVSADPERTSREHGVAAIPRSGSPWTLLKTLLHSRAIVVGGGDQFKLMKPVMNRSRYSLLILDALLASTARFLHKSLSFVGIGIGNIATRRARLLTRWTLKRTTAVSFRDAHSFHLAQTLSPQTAIYHSTDLVFLSAPQPTPSGNPSAISHLGIAPCVHLDRAEAYGHVMGDLARSADLFLSAHPDRHVTFLPFQTGFAAHHDILVSQEIRTQIRHSERCSLAKDLNLATVHPLYAALDILWGMRLHSVILACLHAVPFIALIYDVKVQNFLQEIGCEEWGIPLDGTFTAERLFLLQERLETRAPAVRQHLRMQAARLRNQAQVNVQLLHAIAEESALPVTVQSDLPSHSLTSSFHPS